MPDAAPHHHSADVAVLGAGPAGLMAALRLARSGRSVVVLEQQPHVGGMAHSPEIAGVRVDLGSHRLHPVVAPRLLTELQGLLGNDLQTRTRKGRINLEGRWLGFPLRLGDLARNLPRPMLARIGVDTLTGPLRKPKGDTAGDVIAARLGPTVARNFYVPYLTKLWDASPDELAAELADRRVSARSGTAVIKKALRTRKPGGGTFLYPRRGFGQFSDAIADAAVAAGADLRLGAGVEGVRRDDDGYTVTTAAGTVTAPTLCSTIPIPVLARIGDAPADVVAAADRLRHRAMVLVYLVFEIPRLTEYDAHYFPELKTPVSRMSEPKNFRASADDPPGVTVLCAELACWVGDEIWEATPEALADRVLATLAPMGFDFPALAGTEVRRIPRCYPSYTGTYAADLATLERWADAQPRLLTFGRQGLFAPDNTHHALHMGWEAADALRPDGTVDRPRWTAARESFRSHVVED